MLLPATSHAIRCGCIASATTIIVLVHVVEKTVGITCHCQSHNKPASSNEPNGSLSNLSNHNFAIMAAKPSIVWCYLSWMTMVAIEKNPRVSHQRTLIGRAPHFNTTLINGRQIKQFKLQLRIGHPFAQTCTTSDPGYIQLGI